MYFQLSRRIERQVRQTADELAGSIEIEEDVFLGLVVERRGVGGDGKLDRIVELIDAHEIDGDHEEHDQLQNEIEQRREIDFARVSTDISRHHGCLHV